MWRETYKIALSHIFSTVPDVETLIINVGEVIIEATDKDVVVKRSSEEGELCLGDSLRTFFV